MIRIVTSFYHTRSLDYQSRKAVPIRNVSKLLRHVSGPFSDAIPRTVADSSWRSSRCDIKPVQSQSSITYLNFLAIQGHFQRWDERFDRRTEVLNSFPFFETFRGNAFRWQFNVFSVATSVCCRPKILDVRYF